MKVHTKRLPMKPSFAALVYQVVKESPDPLPVREILSLVNRMRPVETNSPLQTIRHALGQCRLIANTGEGRYGWYPRLIDGSRVRVPLNDSDLAAHRIVFDDEVRDLLWPGFFAIQSLQDRQPVHATLAEGGKPTTLPLQFYGGGVWGTEGSAELWKWLKARRVRGGDAVIVEAEDAGSRRYRVSLDLQSGRDESAVRQRTEAVEQAAREYAWNRRAQGCAVWDIAKHLLVAGCYRYPVPPDPISPMWSRVQSHIGAVTAFASDRGRTRKPAGKVYQLKIVLKESQPPIWRRVLVPDSATLEDLHRIVQVIMGWTDSHLHQFEIDGDCYTSLEFHWDGDGKTPGDESRITLGKAFKQRKSAPFAYEYDFGDSWQHEIVIEDILSPTKVETSPLCIDGRRACPPEDCGGVWGYLDFLNAIGDSSNPDRAELLEWAGGTFDPERCDVTAINWKLKRIFDLEFHTR